MVAGEGLEPSFSEIWTRRDTTSLSCFVVPLVKTVSPREGGTWYLAIERFELSCFRDAFWVRYVCHSIISPHGLRGGVRIHDPSIKGAVLYQLSYTKSLRPITVGVFPDDLGLSSRRTIKLRRWRKRCDLNARWGTSPRQFSKLLLSTTQPRFHERQTGAND